MLFAAGERQEWLLPREHCLYFCLDCRTVPAAKRRAYIETCLKRALPFSPWAYQLIWQDAHAMVWAWPEETVQSLAQGLPVGQGRANVFPESLVLSSRALDEVQLLRLRSGVEGRVWRAGVLVHSAWWPEDPSVGDWVAFRRQAGLSADEPMPEPRSVAFTPRPWSSQGLGDWRQFTAGTRRLGQGLAACIVLAAFAFEVGAWRRAENERAALVGEMENQDKSLQAILDARNTAEQDRAAMAKLLELRAPAGPLTVMARFKSALSEQAGTLRQWQLLERERLEVLLHADRLDPEALVRALEKSGHFSEVSVNVTGNRQEMIVRARVRVAAMEDAG